MNIPMNSAKTLETFIEIAYTARVDSSCWPRDAGGSTSNPTPSALLISRLSVLDGEALAHFQIDAIEPPPAAEHLLRRIDVHDREVAAKGAGQTARPHDAAHRKRLVPDHRRQCEAIADAEIVPRRELVRDDDRIGLREKHERVVDDRFVAALEVVLAQAAIACHVDAENQNVSLAGDPRRRRRLDDGDRHLHLGNRLDALEYLFWKTGLARRHLQLGCAGDAIDRSLECVEHRLIRRVHRDEHGDAEHDADHGEQRTHRVFLEIRPTDEAQ